MTTVRAGFRQGGSEGPSASLKPSLEADYLEAAGSLKEDSDYGRKDCSKRWNGPSCPTDGNES